MAASLEFDQVMFGFPAYRVFIFGYEVTEDVVDVTVSWKTGRAPSFATIQLLNLNDRYVYRHSDLIALNSDAFRRFADRSSQNAGASIATGAFAATANELVHEVDVATNGANPIVDGVLDMNSVKGQATKLRRNPAYSIGTNPVNPFTGATQGFRLSPIYPIIEGKSIFYQNDPVRIFLQDPFDPQIWYYGFSGFITLVSDNVSGNALEKTLSITVEDVSKSLRYSRIATNPAIRDPAIVKQSSDITSFTGSSSALTNLTMPEAADLLVFGDGLKKGLTASSLVSVPVVDKNGNTFQRTSSKTGAGNFKYSDPKDRVFTLADSNSTERSTITLERWQNEILDHRVKLADIATLLARSDSPKARTGPGNVALIQSQIEAETNPGRQTAAIIKEIGEDPFNYPVDGGTLLMLLPEGLDALGNEIISADYTASQSMISEFQNRRNVMYDLVDRVEFVFYADPKGNLVIEFPLYDFDPDDFGVINRGTTKTAVATQIRQADGTVSTVDITPVANAKFTVKSPDNEVTYDNERRFTIEDECVVDFGAVDDDAQVRTGCRTAPQVDRRATSTSGFTVQNAATTPQAVVLESLIPIYGYREIQGGMQKLVLTDKSALIAGAIELNKVNSNAYTFKVNILPRFLSWLNRPYLVRHRNHIGCAAAITHKISWFGTCDTSIQLAYMRGWSGQIDSLSGKLVYTNIGGEDSRPINYATLFAKNKSSNALKPGTSSGSGVQ